MDNKLFLNLGCGELPIKDCVNVDIKPMKHIDKVVDLSKLSWPWPDSSVDGIYMIHSLEHFINPLEIINECHRILKPGGFLYLQVPHSSLVTGIGNIQHYRTFSIELGSLINGKFEEVLKEIRWWGYPRNRKHPYVTFTVENKASSHPIIYMFLIRPISFIIQSLINLNPNLFERIWCYYVGGADEVVYKGIKI